MKMIYFDLVYIKIYHIIVLDKFDKLYKLKWIYNLIFIRKHMNFRIFILLLALLLLTANTKN